MARGESLQGGISPESGFDIVRAVSFERRKVRVYFSNQPKAVFDRGADDALNPASWAITPRQDLPLLGSKNPAYTTVEVTKASTVVGEPLAIDVHVDDDFSFDVQYQVSISASVVSADNIGGWTSTGELTAVFEPYDPPCRQKPVVRIFDWFGNAAKKYDFSGDTGLFMSILQDIFEQVKSLIDCFPEQYDPLYCHEDFLDSRMRSLGNPFEFFTSEMTVKEKRRVALQLIDIYRLKGTREGIKTAVQNILGITDVEVISFNEMAWRIGESHEQLAIPFDGQLPEGEVNTPFLGGGLYVPTGGPPGYPTSPIDPYRPENFQHTGTTFLGGGPVYNQAVLGGGDLTDDTKNVARVGRWNLAGPGDVQYPLDPAEVYRNDPTLTQDSDYGVTEEPGRRGLYSYYIALPVGFEPTTLERQRIETIAKYMQPSQMHLTEIKAGSSEYNPMVLGTSLLGIDWFLHGPEI